MALWFFVSLTYSLTRSAREHRPLAHSLAAAPPVSPLPLGKLQVLQQAEPTKHKLSLMLKCKTRAPYT